jgi:hypothetical protein
MTKALFALAIAFVGTVFSVAFSQLQAAPIAPLTTDARNHDSAATPVSWHISHGFRSGGMGAKLGHFRSVLPLLAGGQDAGGIASMLGGAGNPAAIQSLIGGMAGAGDMGAIAPMLGGLAGSGNMNAIAPMLGGLMGSGNMGAIAPMLGGFAGAGGATPAGLAGRSIPARARAMARYGNPQIAAGGAQGLGGYSRLMQGLGGTGGIDVARIIGMAQSMGLGAGGGW